MLQDSTKTLLMQILRSLETAGEAEWDDQIELCKECLYEMHQMTRPLFQPFIRDSQDAPWPTRKPSAARFTRALPHVKTMAGAIRRRDQATALESGRAALAAM